MTEIDPNQWLMGGGVQSFKFANPGDKVSGFITHMSMLQQTDFKTQKPLFWDNGDPKMQMAVTLTTTLAESDDDDGNRRIFVKGQMQKAIQEAVKKAGARGLAEGGELAVQYTGDGEAERGMNPPKLYRARYAPPVMQVGPGDEDEPF